MKKEKQLNTESGLEMSLERSETKNDSSLDDKLPGPGVKVELEELEFPYSENKLVREGNYFIIDAVVNIDCPKHGFLHRGPISKICTVADAYGTEIFLENNKDITLGTHLNPMSLAYHLLAANGSKIRLKSKDLDALEAAYNLVTTPDLYKKELSYLARESQFKRDFKPKEE